MGKGRNDGLTDVRAESSEKQSLIVIQKSTYYECSNFDEISRVRLSKVKGLEISRVHIMSVRISTKLVRTLRDMGTHTYETRYVNQPLTYYYRSNFDEISRRSPNTYTRECGRRSIGLPH